MKEFKLSDRGRITGVKTEFRIKALSKAHLGKSHIRADPGAAVI